MSSAPTIEPVPDDTPTGCRMTLEPGIACHEWRLGPCEATEDRPAETSEVDAK
jgi:hypothetical protein